MLSHTNNDQTLITLKDITNKHITEGMNLIQDPYIQYLLHTYPDIKEKFETYIKRDRGILADLIGMISSYHYFA
jgi:hypothetical protein